MEALADYSCRALGPEPKRARRRAVPGPAGRWSAASDPCSRGDPHPAPEPPNRGSVRLLDPSLRSLPREATPGRTGGRRKYPSARRELAWQWAFPAMRLHRHPDTGELRRHHYHESAIQRAVKHAVARAGLAKPAGCHTFRHSFATHLLEDGYDIRTVQEPLGHRDVRAVMVYTHVLKRAGRVVVRPVELFAG